MGYDSNRKLKHCLKAKFFHNVLKILVTANFAGKGNICYSLISSDKVVGREKKCFGARESFFKSLQIMKCHCSLIYLTKHKLYQTWYINDKVCKCAFSTLKQSGFCSRQSYPFGPKMTNNSSLNICSCLQAPRRFMANSFQLLFSMSPYKQDPNINARNKRGDSYVQSEDEATVTFIYTYTHVYMYVYMYKLGNLKLKSICRQT